MFLQASKSGENGQPQFPIDFFEHCVAMTDVEFGGNDLLQVYNTVQIKHRLNTTGTYDLKQYPAFRLTYSIH